jgi:hypothetical protein
LLQWDDCQGQSVELAFLWLTWRRQDPEMGKVVQVQGDQRQNIFNFLTQENICEKSQIKIHGF